MKKYRLVLNQLEIDALYSILGSIGGDENSTARGLFSGRKDSIHEKLRSYISKKEYFGYPSGSIYFSSSHYMECYFKNLK